MIPSDQQPAEDETTFDIYEIDEQIIKNDEYVQKKSSKLKEVKNRFKFVSGLTKEEIKKKDPNSDYLKYFAQISTKNFQYIGNLSSQLKREKYGYSLMDNKDEFLGEYKNENRNGFGIYKFHPNDGEQEIYIGDYINNSKTGKGIYLKIFKSIKDDSTDELNLVNFNCGMGTFQDDIFKSGKIFSVDYENETLYKGNINEIGLPSDKEALIFEGGDKIFMGNVVDGELHEGRNIIVDEKWDKKKGYYFTKSGNKNEPYTFNIYKDEENAIANAKRRHRPIIKNFINSAFYLLR